MPDYIDKETVLQDMGERYDCYNPEIEADRNIRKGLIFARMIIDKQSTADVQELKHGKWEEIRDAYGQLEGWIHTECGREVKIKENYCPCCGARMINPHLDELSEKITVG